MTAAAKHHGYGAIALNFGNGHGPESHVLVLVRCGTGKRIFYDPTLGCYSGKADGIFDCLLFRISTSGEDEVEELAEQLRGIIH